VAADPLSRVFSALADPTRRDMVARLAIGDATVNELARPYVVTVQAVSKHLKVLRDGGFVESRVEAQRRVYRLNPRPLQEIDAWLLPFRRFWSRHVDALEQHLERMEKNSSVKGKKRHGKP